MSDAAHPPALVDIGVNLTHKSFRHDRDAVLQQAAAVGVTQMVLTGTDLRSSRDAYQLTKAYPGRLFSTAGVHPHDAAHCDDHTIPGLRALAAHDAVVAIGECGLDFNRDFSPRPKQEFWFEEQLALAASLQMPVFLHERDAHERFVSILGAYHDELTAGVVHCFTGSRDALFTYLDMGMYIGITGWVCDERRGGPLRELIPSIPSDRLMIETDAPFLMPRDLKPRPKKSRNEPRFLPHILQSIAALRGEDPAVLAASTTEVTRRFFGLPAPPSS